MWANLRHMFQLANGKASINTVVVLAGPARHGWQTQLCAKRHCSTYNKLLFYHNDGLCAMSRVRVHCLKMSELFCPIFPNICYSGWTNFPNHVKIYSHYKCKTQMPLFHSSVLYIEFLKHLASFLHVRRREDNDPCCFHIFHETVTSASLVHRCIVFTK